MFSQPILISLALSLLWLAVIVLLVVRGKLGKFVAALLLILPLLAGNLYYFHLLRPQQQQQTRLDAAQDRLASIPVWRTIKVQQPALYQQASEELRQALIAGMTEQQALDRLRPLLSDLLGQRIGAAEDADIIRYIRISVEEMKQLRQQSAELCFRFIYPQVKGGVEMSERLPQALTESEMAAIETLLINSLGAEQESDLKAGRAQLQSVVMALYKQWGSDLQSLNTPAEPGVDKGKLCDMTIDLYQSVLALGDKKSANVLRIIISGTGN